MTSPKSKKIDFQNTQVAFKHLSNAQLRTKIWLFKFLSFESSVFLAKISNFTMRIGVPIAPVIKHTVFKQFCGGETLQECKQTVRKLAEFSVGTTLDYSSETDVSNEARQQTLEEIRDCIDFADEQEPVQFAVSKLSACVDLEKLVEELKTHKKPASKSLITSLADFKKLIKKAATQNVKLFIDAEHSWIQPAIDWVAEDLMREFNKDKVVVFTTVQMYRHDRLVYIENLIQKAIKNDFKIGVKLVRGAYMELERERAKEKGYEDPIQPSKEATDSDYDKALDLMFDRLDQVSFCVGTHNQKSIQYAVDKMMLNGLEVDDSRVYFSQLYGMGDNLTYPLAKKGFNVSKYLPYGPVKTVMPYLVRRAQENTSIQGQTSRELRLLQKEQERRNL